MEHDASQYNKGIAAAVFYGVCSASMAFANKALMSSYEFKFPFFILLVQMLVSIVVTKLLTRLKVIEVSDYNLQQAKQLLLPSICAVLHSSLALIALEGMNVPMYAAVKRCTPLVNLVLSLFILHKPLPSCAVIFSILLITFGCLIAGFGDLSFHFAAYTVAFFSVLIQGFYQTLIQKASEKNLQTIDIFVWNCYNSIPMYLVGVLWTFEINKISSYKYSSDIGFILCLILVTLLGSLMNFSLFLSTSLTSALTTSLVGVMKSVIQTVIGFFTFGGVAYHPLNVFGIVLNTVGGFVYTYAKYKERKVPISSNETDGSPKSKAHV